MRFNAKVVLAVVAFTISMVLLVGSIAFFCLREFEVSRTNAFDWRAIWTARDNEEPQR